MNLVLIYIFCVLNKGYYYNRYKHGYVFIQAKSDSVLRHIAVQQHNTLLLFFPKDGHWK